MAHLTTIGAGIYTYLDIFSGTIPADTDTAAEFAALFQTVNSGDIQRMPSVREFPSVGTPSNIVNVPVYGQATSSQIQGQSDAPSLDVTVNYVPEDMLAIEALKGTQVAFRVMMSNGNLALADSLGATIASENTEFYFLGKIEAVLVNPQLTDATTATVTLSAQSDFYGPATVAAA